MMCSGWLNLWRQRGWPLETQCQTRLELKFENGAFLDNSRDASNNPSSESELESDFGIGAESLVGGGTGPSSNAVGVGK